MTNDEIKKRAAVISERYTPRFDYDPKDDALADEIATLVSALVVQAYEEATQKLQDLKCLPETNDVYTLRYNCALDDGARHIRALKDQLVQEPSSDHAKLNPPPDCYQVTVTAYARHT